MAGGLAAAWVMNVFMAGPGQTLQQAVQSDEENRQHQEHSDEPKEDATMKAADAIAHTATGEHLSRDDKEKGGSIVHYAFGAIAGGVYGGLAEYSSAVTSGSGTRFGVSAARTCSRSRLSIWDPPPQTSPFGLGVAVCGAQCLWSYDRIGATNAARAILSIRYVIRPTPNNFKISSSFVR